MLNKKEIEMSMKEQGFILGKFRTFLFRLFH
jgi:hypothetical protein